MERNELNDLLAFAAVARERSFTRAAAILGMSPSALSHAMRGLEERLGVRLLSRTTRSVAPTEPGERLLQSLNPALANGQSGCAGGGQFDDGLTDIVTAGFDAGIRLGEAVAKDMVAVKLGPDLRTVVVGTPSYFERYPPPLTPYDLERPRLYRIPADDLRRTTALGIRERWQGDQYPH